MSSDSYSRFEIQEPFFLKSRGKHVVPGHILEGVFRAGQIGHFEEQPRLMFHLDAVEFVLCRSYPNEEFPALVFSDLSPEHARFLECLSPRTCFIVSTPTPSGSTLNHKA